MSSAKRYIAQILETVLFPVYKELKTTIPNTVFQRDGHDAPAHKSQVIME